MSLRWFVRADNVPQLDLVGMMHGFEMEATDCDNGSFEVVFTRNEPT